MLQAGLAEPMTQDLRFKSLGVVCLALWLGIMGFGLWPFDFFPKNHVMWLQNENGLHFDRYGEAYSTTPWTMSPKSAASRNGSSSVEIWLHSWESEYPGVSAIFSVGDPARLENFAIVQSGSDLFVRGQFLDDKKRSIIRKLWLDNAVRSGEPRFVTLTSGPEGTALYLEGLAQKRYPFTLKIDNFLGPILLGHAPAGHRAWTGDLLGLAVYERALTDSEVSEHYQAWREARTAELITRPGIAAFYPFDERAGDIIHNRAGSAPELLIPTRFNVLHPTILSPRLNLDRSDLGDVIINILGFVPLGFFLCAYLYHAKHLGKVRALVLTVVLGAITSLVIELLQAYLPSRDSSLLDIIDNTLGTALGAVLHTALANFIVRRSKVASS